MLLRLQPDALGALKVRLDLSEGVVTARFEASSEEARRLLDAGLPELKAALEARGLAVERLEVRHGPPLPERAGDSAAGEPRHGDPGGAGADGGGREPEAEHRAAWTSHEGTPGIATDGEDGDSELGGPGGAPLLADYYRGGDLGISIGLDAVA